MKKTKLLIPIITLAGTASIAAPMMCLTSCKQGETEETHFSTPAESKTVTTQQTAGTITYTFTTNDTLTDKQASLIEFIAICNTSGSNISLTRCRVSKIEAQNKTFTVSIDYSINPDAFVKGETFQYDIKIHNGTWYQLEMGFSIVAPKI